MAAHFSHDQLVSALERRFDYQSARSVAAELLGVAGVGKADTYDAAALAKIRAAAETSLSRAAQVLENLPAAHAAHAHSPAASHAAAHAAAPSSAHAAPAPVPSDAAKASANAQTSGEAPIETLAEAAESAEKLEKKKK